MFVEKSGNPGRSNCKKAKQLRRERWQKKHGNVPLVKQTKYQDGKSLQDFLSEVKPDAAHNLEVIL